MSAFGFWAAAAAMAAVALAFLLPPLLRRRTAPPAPAAGSNVAVLREQRDQLAAEHAAGKLDEAAYREALAEIERRVLDEEREPAARAAEHGPARGSAIAVGLLVPLLAVGLYTAIGEPEGLDPSRAEAAQQAAVAASAAEIEGMVEALAQRMEREPERVDGWVLLARSYAAMQRYADAARAYARAVALLPDEPRLLVDYADVLAASQGNVTAGEPARLIEKALALEPDNLKALALAGNVAVERGDYAEAARRWRRVLDLAPPESPLAASSERSLVELQAMARQAQAPQQAASGAAAASAPAAPVASSAVLAGRVRLAPELAARVQPGDTVFVFARAAEGPRMPLAIRRYSAGALPLEFTLDDSTAMSPELRLSKFDRVVVGARVSKSGNAIPQPGDLLTQSEPLPLGRRDLELVIDRVQP